MGRSRKRRSRKRTLLVALIVVLLGAGVAVAPSAIADWRRPRNDRRDISSLDPQSLDGRGNNRNHPDWGRAGTPYARVTQANYADGRSTPVTGPNTRYISNRVFSDLNQNIFSERKVTQWGFVWGQFVDHTIGHRDEQGTPANIPFSSTDPLEAFTDTVGSIPFVRSAITPGTGTRRGNPAQQTNTVASFLDASPVYGSDAQREEWLRDGPVDGNLRNNAATLLLPDGLLPRRDSRGNAATAPEMAVDGRLLGQPARAVVAGDVRANENIGLTAIQTLFAREHNRIVAKLPNWLSAEEKFQVARRIVIAEEQYITYREFLPAMGVKLPSYRGYNPRVDTSVTNEFATVGYRAHSMIHGEIEVETEASRYAAAQLKALTDEGIEVEPGDDPEDVEITVPLNVAFFNPDVVGQIQLGPLLTAFGAESEYNNDEQIDNQLRSVLFQVAPAGNPACADNLDGPGLTQCFSGVVDLGAIDVERGRDHGMPSYNDLRKAYGLAPKFSFTEITGETSEDLPAGTTIDDPAILDITSLTDITGKPLVRGTEAGDTTATHEVRRSTLAARLKGIYGTTDKVDAFVGMITEPHVAGADMGELQLAMWQRQFQALRDGDRFFYGNDPGLTAIQRTLGIDYRRSLADLIALNTDIPRSDLPNSVFVVNDKPAAPADTPPTTAPTTPSASTPSATTRATTSAAAPAGIVPFQLPAGTAGRASTRTPTRIRRRRAT